MIPVLYYRDLATYFPQERAGGHEYPITSPENCALSRNFLLEGVSAGRPAFFYRITVFLPVSVFSF